MESLIEVGFWSLVFLRIQRSKRQSFRLQLSAPSGSQEASIASQTAEINSFCAALGPKANGGAKLT